MRHRITPPFRCASQCTLRPDAMRRVVLRLFPNLVLAISATLSFCTEPLPGQDRVTVRTSSSVRTYEGVIRDFTGREGLVFQGRNDLAERFTLERIVDIQTRKNESHLAADEAFERDDFQTALELYRKAKETETRSWMRQNIGAFCVRSLKALGRFEEAVEEFFLMTRSDPLTPYMACVPLVWISSSGSFSVGLSPSERLALQWIDSGNNPSGIENPAASLAAASILLSCSVATHRATAERQLEKLTFLSSHDNVKNAEFHEKTANEAFLRKQLALLANAQLWRTKLIGLKSENDFAHWEPIVTELLEPFRLGPYLLLGEAYATVGNREKAVLHRMRVPILTPFERELAAKALLESAQDLRALRREKEARTLLEEIVRDYPDQKNFVQDAKSALNRLKRNEKND